MKHVLIVLVVLVLVSCGSTLPAQPQAGMAVTIPVPSTTVIHPSPTLVPLTPVSVPTVAIPTLAALQFTDDHALALKPAFAGDSFLMNWPQYRMLIDVDPLAGTVQGSQVITYTNQTATPLDSLMLRSYVNFPPDIMGDGGTTFMNVMAASVDQQSLEISVEAQATAFRLKLPATLQPGNEIVINTTFQGTIEAWDDGSWLYLSAYPMLAVWNAEANDWFADVTTFPDHVYAQTALYDVEVRLPTPYETFATGSAITSSSDGTVTTTRFVSGPVREWAASFGIFKSASMISNGITVTVYQVEQSTLDLERMLDVAVDSLASYEDRIGPYPYRELDLHASQWRGDAGIEFPGYTVILVNQAVNQRTDFVVAHEVAHQWWYALVGNDIYRAPWLDESFANFSSIVMFEDYYGEDLAQQMFVREIERLYESGVQSGDAPVGWSIYEYSSFNQYYWAIYGKGALFLIKLRETLGADVFWRGMQRYYQAARYQVTDRALFKQAMETESGLVLSVFFETWLDN